MWLNLDNLKLHPFQWLPMSSVFPHFFHFRESFPQNEWKIIAGTVIQSSWPHFFFQHWYHFDRLRKLRIYLPWPIRRFPEGTGTQGYASLQAMLLNYQTTGTATGLWKSYEGLNECTEIIIAKQWLQNVHLETELNKIKQMRYSKIRKLSKLGIPQ